MAGYTATFDMYCARAVSADRLSPATVQLLFVLIILSQWAVADAASSEPSEPLFRVMPGTNASSNFAPDCQPPQLQPQRPQSLSGSGLWEIRIERDLSSRQDLVLALDYPYPSDFRVAVPDNSSVIRRSRPETIATGPGRRGCR